MSASPCVSKISTLVRGSLRYATARAARIARPCYRNSYVPLYSSTCCASRPSIKRICYAGRVSSRYRTPSRANTPPPLDRSPGSMSFLLQSSGPAPRPVVLFAGMPQIPQSSAPSNGRCIRPEFTSTPVSTPCATPLPRTCWPQVRTSAPFNSCSDTATWKPR